ncbi:hypothetical protein EVAR_60714_1 [Eumeta japonica]|uniref:Uncharacterized protein n=1 Tax=Eumeta variegata TaxID=151549 RepID=A0A4C1ZCM9_EUMVA|nr:hypothetical protein EVAR_60714_1 [Eumeta japonica]
MKPIHVHDVYGTSFCRIPTSAHMTPDIVGVTIRYGEKCVEHCTSLDRGKQTVANGGFDSDAEGGGKKNAVFKCFYRRPLQLASGC